MNPELVEWIHGSTPLTMNPELVEWIHGFETTWYD